jgi:YHS domain-containing protein
MIVLLVLLGGFVLRGPLVDAARNRLSRGIGGGHDHQAMVGVSHERQDELEHEPWSTKLRSKAAWADAASYTMADITMLRKELVIGYGVAGFLSVLVPMAVWNTLFISGHGFWTSVENALIGPIIAFLSFVCSIGNVPMAAALWHGGISFGGVISFIFADLIAFPLVIIYRKYYGGRLALRLVLVFYVVMAAAGLIVEGLFSLLGLVPTTRPETIAAAHFEWNYTTWLNIAFLIVLAVLYWLYRNRERLGGGQGYAIDPVCGMQVETAHAPAHSDVDGTRYWFCSDRCRERFEANPTKHLEAAAPDGGDEIDEVDPTGATPGSQMAVDPVCGMTVDPAVAAHRRYAGHDYSFCNPGCTEAFDADPTRYALGTTADPPYP